MELGQGRVRLGVRERVCTQRLLKHWDRLPRAVNMAPSLLEFKKCLDSALRHMVCFLSGPVWSQELDSTILVCPFQLRTVCDSKSHSGLLPV